MYSQVSSYKIVCHILIRNHPGGLQRAAAVTCCSRMLTLLCDVLAVVSSQINFQTGGLKCKNYQPADINVVIQQNCYNEYILYMIC